MRYQYAITLRKNRTKEELVNALRQIEGVKQIKLSSSPEITSI
jgi:hypothetical protein